MLEKVFDRLCGLEDRLHDVRAFEVLEERVRCLEENVNELKERLIENEEKDAQNEVKVGLGNSVAVWCEEESEIESRKNNVLMYKVKEIDSDIAEDRKAGDMLFIHELCNETKERPILATVSPHKFTITLVLSTVTVSAELRQGNQSSQQEWQNSDCHCQHSVSAASIHLKFNNID